MDGQPGEEAVKMASEGTGIRVKSSALSLRVNLIAIN